MLGISFLSESHAQACPAYICHAPRAAPLSCRPPVQGVELSPPTAGWRCRHHRGRRRGKSRCL